MIREPITPPKNVVSTKGNQPVTVLMALRIASPVCHTWGEAESRLDRPSDRCRTMDVRGHQFGRDLLLRARLAAGDRLPLPWSVAVSLVPGVRPVSLVSASSGHAEGTAWVLIALVPVVQVPVVAGL